MKSDDNYSDIISDISLLYELSLSIGTSLDIDKNCDSFITKLLSRKNLSFASVWIHEKYLPCSEHDGTALVYANPKFRAQKTKIDASNTLLSLIENGEPVSVNSNEPEFKDIVLENKVENGAYLIFPLEDIGFLKIYSTDIEVDTIILNKLRNVVLQFAISIKACLLHEQSLLEIEERKRVEKELLESKKRFEDMAEMMPAAIYESDPDGNIIYLNRNGLDILEYSGNDIIAGISLQSLVSLKHKEELKYRIGSLASGNKLSPTEYEMVTKSGKKINAIISSTPIKKGDEIIGIQGIALDISEIKNMENLLTDAKMIETANRVKGEFFANMSHELRTPLNAIIGFSDVLKNGSFGDLNEKQSKYASNIHSSGEKLLELINNLLSVSKIEVQNAELNYEEFDVMRAVIEVMDAIKPVATRENVNLKFSTDPLVDTIDADKNKFKQIMYNLLQHSIKFADRESHIKVHLSIVAKMLKISISNPGTVLSDIEKKIIYGKFMQMNDMNPNSCSEHELELLLTKKFIEMHKGHIDLSDGDHGSLTFTFYIPLNSKENPYIQNAMSEKICLI